MNFVDLLDLTDSGGFDWILRFCTDLGGFEGRGCVDLEDFIDLVDLS